MRPDDPRHGTYAGVQVHHKERARIGPAADPMCEPCRLARRRYQKRLEGDIANGRRRRVDPAVARRHVERLLAAGFTVKEVKDRAGVSPRTVYNLLNGRTGSVTAGTMRRLLSVPQPTPDERHVPERGYMPRFGAERRIRALVAIGHTLTELSRRTGFTRSNLCGLAHGGYRDRPNVMLQATTWRRIAAVYDELHMTPGTGRYAKTARTIARRNGWAPPMSWDDIDDPDEVPKGLGRDTRGHRWVRPPDRLSDLVTLDAAAASLPEVCAKLDVTKDALWKWCDRHGHLDLYERIAARSRAQTNGAVAARGWAV